LEEVFQKLMNLDNAELNVKKYCPFHSSYKVDSNEERYALYQECGENCELYNAERGECVFETMSNSMGRLAERLKDLTKSMNRR
jgi:hypothetical protein